MWTSGSSPRSAVTMTPSTARVPSRQVNRAWARREAPRHSNRCRSVSSRAAETPAITWAKKGSAKIAESLLETARATIPFLRVASARAVRLGEYPSSLTRKSGGPDPGLRSAGRYALEIGCVAQLVKLVEEPAGLTGFVLGVKPVGEVVGAEVLVGLVAGEHGPNGDQDRVADRDQGPFLAATRDDTPVAGSQVGALAAGGVDRDLAQDGFEPRVTVPGRGWDTAGAGLVVARAHPGPGGQVRGGTESGRVGADLSEDDLGGAAADRGDGLDQVELPAKGLHLPVDLVAEPLFHRGARVDAVQHRPSQEGVVLTEAAGECLCQQCAFAPHPGQGEISQCLRVAFPADQRFQHRPGRLTGQVRHHRRQLHPGVFQQLLQALDLPGAFPDDLGAVAVQIPQLPDRFRRHEPGPDQAVLDQLRDPLAVLDI